MFIRLLSYSFVVYIRVVIRMSIHAALHGYRAAVSFRALNRFTQFLCSLLFVLFVLFMLIGSLKTLLLVKAHGSVLKQLVVQILKQMNMY